MENKITNKKQKEDDSPYYVFLGIVSIYVGLGFAFFIEFFGTNSLKIRISFLIVGTIIAIIFFIKAHLRYKKFIKIEEDK